jgi:hypothetical protein
MFLRSLVVWFALLCVAVANGAVREGLIRPRFGELTGHVASTILLSAAILLVAWFAIGWLRPAASRDALLIGGFWLMLTLAFEFLAGHYLFGHPWSRLLADYNLLRGRIWVLVLVATAFAPLVAAYGRLFPSR